MSLDVILANKVVSRILGSRAFVLVADPGLIRREGQPDVALADIGGFQAAYDAELLEHAREGARARITNFVDGLTAQITSRYPTAEVISWDRQFDAAETYLELADNSPARYLRILDSMRDNDAGETRQAIAQSIHDKGVQFEEIAGHIRRLRKRAETGLQGISDLAEIEPFLAALIEQVRPLAAMYDLTIAEAAQ